MNKTTKAKIILDSKGFGLIEVLIAAAVGSVVMMGMSQMMTSMNLSVRGTRTMASRDELKTRIAREAGNPSSLKKSAWFSSNASYPGFPVNGPGTQLYTCSEGGGCSANDPTTHVPIQHPVTLTDSFGVPITGPDEARAAVYDVNGTPCGNNSVKPATPNCPIVATSYFIAQCADTTQDTCDTAGTIHVYYQLAQASTVPLLNGGPTLATSPPGDVSVGVPFMGGATGAAKMMAKWVSSTQLGASSSMYEDPTTHHIGVNDTGTYGAGGPWGRFDVSETRSETSLGTAQVATETVQQSISVPSTSSANFVSGYFTSSSDGSNHDLTTGINALVGHANWWDSTAKLWYGHGVSGVARNHSTGIIDTGIGTDGSVTNEGTGTINYAAGVNGRVQNYTSSGTITNAYGGWFQIQPVSGVGGPPPGYKKITNGYGVMIDNLDAINKWALYSTDSGAPSYFAGSVGIGTNAPTAPLQVTSANASNISIKATGNISAFTADFAEWVDWGDKPKPEMGSVIHYKGSYVVVSSPKTAAFIGNDKHDHSKEILVAFAGQLPVRIRGPVHVGDLIIGAGDGTALAVAKKDATIEMAQKAVGTAWEASDDPGLKRVNVAVGIGLSGGGARDIASLHELKQENAALSKEVSDLKSRLAQIEKALKLH